LIVFSSFPCNNLVVCIVDVFIISYYCVGGWNRYRLDINMSLLWKKIQLLWVMTRSAWKYIKVGLKRVVFFPGKGGYPKWWANYVVGFLVLWILSPYNQTTIPPTGGPTCPWVERSYTQNEKLLVKKDITASNSWGRKWDADFTVIGESSDQDLLRATDASALQVG
jgi:hypothetical protein